HRPWPQPNFVPVMPSTSRSVQSSGVSSATSISRGLPLMLSLTMHLLLVASIGAPPGAGTYQGHIRRQPARRIHCTLVSVRAHARKSRGQQRRYVGPIDRRRIVCSDAPCVPCNERGAEQNDHPSDPPGCAMNDLLKNVLDAHGGLARWSEFSTVRASIVTG